MTLRTGFLEHRRAQQPRRPVAERLRDQREVYLPLPLHTARQQGSRCMDCGVAFCHSACPLGNLIPEWNDLVSRDDWYEAAVRLDATNNFPEFTGRLCPAPCEPACVLALADEPVAIKSIEQAIIDRAFAEGWVRPEPPPHRTCRRVAVVGSGPAGLAAAQQLNRAGHLVTVYERSDRIGGLLRYGIPDFKMEKWVLDRRLALLEAEGIVFETGYEAGGATLPVATLRERCDAVVLAVGAERSRDVALPGRELRGVHQAMEYLEQQNRRTAGEVISDGAITAQGKRVVIIGGGDTGADCLGNVLRERCEAVEQLYLYPEPPGSRQAHNPWPEWPLILRTHPAHEEGGTRSFARMVTGFGGEHGRVTRVTTLEVTPSAAGRHNFDLVEGSEHQHPADLVLLAIGFDGVRDLPLLDDLGITRTEPGAIAVDGGFATAVDGVFACGDATRGASLIVTAIADGRSAAASCDAYLTARH